MNKLLLGAVSALMLTFSTPVFANTFYFGADLEQVVPKDNDFSASNFDALNFHGGVVVHPNVALEVGASVDNKNEIDLVSLNTDVVGVFPVAYVPKLDGLLTAGLLYKDDQLGPTLGAGLQYHVTEKVAFRGLVKYENPGFDDFDTDYNVKYTLGMNYYF